MLLNHVNDYYKTLAETFRRMFWIGVHPYYLLQCHKEKGIVHFITPIQIGEIYMKNLQGWISGITMPRYAVNVEGGGGKIVLMPSGHDTMNTKVNIDEKISESFANVHTWDDKTIRRYEALGRSTKKEFQYVKIMERFIEKKSISMANLIDDKGIILETTIAQNYRKLKMRKAEMLIMNCFENMR